MVKRTSSNVPQIRFKGFDGLWDEEPIGEVLSERKRPITLRDHQRYELITVKRRNEGVVSRGYLWGREILVKNYSQLEAGDFVISKRQVVHGATGIITSRLDGAIVSNEYLIAVRNGRISTEFLTILAALPDMRKKFYVSSYGVDIEKLFFDAEDWKKRHVVIPGLAEQTQIGQYIRELDSLICLHQSKHEKLVTLKKAMLQKMFPQPGAATPEIRFKGFSESWEGATLGDLIPISSAARVHKHEWTRSGVPFFRTSDVVSHFKGEKNVKAFISFELYKKLADKVGRIKRGDILITGGGSIGIPFLAQSDAALYFKDADLLWLKVPASIDSAYLYTFFSSVFFRKYLESISHIGTIGHYTIEQAKKTPIVLPLQAEQQKIGTYFRTLDELIAKHAVQLDKLKQIKSACLEKMFV